MNELAKRPMTYDEARACADKINANLTNLRQLVVDLHDRAGWAVLGYATWTECVEQEFKQCRSYIFYQFKAAQIEQNVSGSTKVDLGTIPERQLRPLAKLPPDQQRDAWQQAVATAPEGRVTAAHVSKTVKGMMIPEQTKPSLPLQPQMPTDAILSATMAIDQLQSIGEDDPRRDEALREVKLWLKKNTTGSTTKIRARKGKIPAIRHKQLWSSNNQMPIELTDQGVGAD